MKRFFKKTHHTGITTTLGVVVMLLLFFASCSKEVKEVVEVSSDPEKDYTMKATEVSTLISDSGITRYRINAKTWLVFGNAKEPHQYFPDGIYVEKFDTLFRAEASIKADTAYYFEKKGLWRLIGDVHVESLQGEQFDTDELFWNQKEEKVYSEKFIRIQQKEQIITGKGFESNQNMTKYQIRDSQGIFPIEENVQDTSQPADSTQVVASNEQVPQPNTNPTSNIAIKSSAEDLTKNTK